MKKDSNSKKDLKFTFFQNVFDVVRLIPKGRVTTYGAIAKYLGALPGSSRMVGWAMNSSHGQSPPVPAQRVVNRNGMLTGKHHFGSPDLKCKNFSRKRAVKVENDQIVDFNNPVLGSCQRN
jgi:methylated-DNA-protein-cysteine methyltransferase related protein